MVLKVEKLGRALKFPSWPGHHHPNYEALSASLDNFRSKISNFIIQNLFKHEPESQLLSLKGLNKCFDLINTTTMAFAKLVVEIDYPMSRWGGKLTDEYLSYTLNLMGLLNAVSSSISHLNQAKLSIVHSLSLIKTSPLSAAKHVKKITRTNLMKEFKFERPIRVEERDGSEEERVVLQALILSMKIGFLAIGLVVSGLCSDAKPYMEIRKSAVSSEDDSMVKDMDSRLCKEVKGIMEEVKEVNSATDRLSADISTGNHYKSVEELKSRLKVLENSIEFIEKQSDNLFSQVLSTRNKLMDNIRFSG